MWYQPHPYGVLPEGNRIAASNPNRRSSVRIGKRVSDWRFGQYVDLLFQDFSESHREAMKEIHACTRRQTIMSKSMLIPVHSEILLLEEVLPFMDVPELCLLSRVSTAWYVVCHTPEVWKRLAISQVAGRTGKLACRPSERGDVPKSAMENPLEFHRDWKTTAVRGWQGGRSQARAGSKRPRDEPCATARASFVHQPMRVSAPLHSDLLFHSWMCTVLPPSHGLQQHRDGTFHSKLRRVARLSNPSIETFREKFEEPNIPVVLSDVATQWPLFKTLDGDFENVTRKSNEIFPGGVECCFRCESVLMTISQYVHYAISQKDERPLYLFDADYGEKMLAGPGRGLYVVPEYFGQDDYFSVLGKDRPNYRWLIVGPERGGSSFHVDPNYTSAWNACLTGRKRWILFPPSVTPPGVFPSNDMSNVATPVSLTEWLLNYYDTAASTLCHVGYETICEPGEIMFVPCGWWHFVINLEPSVAITQNYVSRCNLSKVLHFLKGMPKSISGLPEDDSADEEQTLQAKKAFAKRFESAMCEAFPEVTKAAIQRIVELAAKNEENLAPATKLDLCLEGDAGFEFSL